MRILILDTYYSSFLETVYAQSIGLAARSYEEQWQALMAECFACADFYSSSLNRLGCDAVEVIANCKPLQLQWARQHGVRAKDSTWLLSLRHRCIPWLYRSAADKWVYTVLKSQVEKFKPDIVLVQDSGFVNPRFLKEIRSSVRLIICQIACPFDTTTFGVYDVVLSSIPHYVDYFRAQGLCSERLNLAFAPQILPRLSATPALYNTVFVGGISHAHTARRNLLDSVASACALDFWGYGAWSLPETSRLRQRHHGEIWGLSMYQVLQQARIVLNHHIGIARNAANNMRLYETTGIGAFLLTDRKDNLGELFEPGQEVAAYSSPEECIEMIHYYLAHEDERCRIARAGQARTLRDHTYDRRMEELVGIIRRHL